MNGNEALLFKLGNERAEPAGRRGKQGSRFGKGEGR